MPARRPYIIGLVIVVAVLIAINGYYFWRSQTPTFWDDSSYLRASLDLYDALTDHGIAGFSVAFAHLLGTKAPLICAFPIPVYLLLGRGGDPRFLVGIGFLILMSVYLFWIGERLWSPKEGLLTVVVLQTMPLMYGLSRQFLVDYGLATMAVMWMYYLMCFRPLSNSGTIVRLGVLLGVGMLMKVTFPLYIIAPTLVIVWYSFREAPSLRDALKTGRSLACVVLIGGIVASSWYLFNWRSILGFAVSAGFGTLAIDYGSANVFAPSVVLEYATKVINLALSCYYGVLLLFLTPIWVLRTWPKILKQNRSTLALLFWLAVPLAVTTFSINKDARYVAPALPAIALGLARLMTDAFGRKPFFRWGAALLLVVPILAYSSASLPAFGVLGELRLGRWVFWSPHLEWYATVPDNAGAWGQREIVETICRDAQPMQPDARVFIPLQHQYLNNENLAYVSKSLKCGVQIIGLPEMHAPKEVADWIQGVKPAYVLVIPVVPDPELAPPFANTMKNEAEAIVTRPDSGFSVMYRGSLGRSGKEIFIYRRELNGT